MKSIKEIAIEIVDFTSQSPLYPIYQVTEVEKILKKYFKGYCDVKSTISIAIFFNGFILPHILLCLLLAYLTSCCKL